MTKIPEFYLTLLVNAPRCPGVVGDCGTPGRFGCWEGGEAGGRTLCCGALSTAQAGCCSSPAEAGARGGGSVPAAYRGNPPSGMSPAPPAAPGNDPTPLYNELRDA